MRLTVQAAPKEHWGWLAIRSGCIFTADFQAIEAVDSRGAVRGMVGYERFSPNSVMAHMAVAHPIAWRELLRPAFFYPFVQRGLGLMLAAVPSTNWRSLGFVERVGFRETYRIRDGHAVGVDTVLHEMRREECRWIGPHEGLQKAS